MLIRAAFALALALSFLPVRAQAPPPDLGVKAVLKLEGSPRRLEQAQWAIGHGTLQLGAGSADRVLCDGQPVGLFFHAPGTFRYTSGNPMERSLFRANVERNTGLSGQPGTAWEERPGALGLTVAVQEGLVLGMPSAFLAGLPPAESLQAAYDAHRPRFQLDLQPVNDGSHVHPREHLLAYASRNAPGRAAAVAELLSGKERLVYRYDEAWARVEALDSVQVRYEAGDAWRLFVPLSCQLLGWNLKEPPQPAGILQDVDLHLASDSKGMTSLDVVETCLPFQPVRLLPLKMLNQLRRGDVACPIRVSSVRDGDGHELAFSHQDDELLVDLGRTAPADRPVRLTFAISGQMLYSRANFDCFELGIEPWFPQPDWDGQFYTLKASLRVPKPFLPLAGGDTLRRSEDGGFNCLEVAFTKPVEGFTVFVGNYRIEEETRGTQTVRVATYGNFTRTAARKLTGLAFGLIDLYTSMLGPFPFKELNIIQDRSLGYGQAPPGILIITDEAFESKSDPIAALYSRGVNHRFAHEIAHQYWGHAVKAPSWEEEWIQESFAEYCSGEALKAIQGKGDGAFKGTLAGWRTNAEAYTSVAPIALANRVCLLDDYRHMHMVRTGLLYNKGPILLQAIRERIGDKDFFRFLRVLQANFQMRFITTEEVRQVLEAVSKQDFKAFFDDCYWGTGLPKS